MKHSLLRPIKVIALISLMLCAGVASAQARLDKVVVARQWGLSYLAGVIMQHEKLLERELEERGLGDVKVEYAQFGGGAAMTDALVSGNLQFGIIGWGPLLTLWSKTKGDQRVKAVAATNSSPMILTTNNPAVHSIKDLSDKDRIAVPSVKVSTNAIMLEMAAAKLYGFDHYEKFDRFTVSMKHPDAVVAMISGHGQITGHVSVQPFAYEELRHPGIRQILTSADVLGGQPTLNLAVTTERVYNQHPKVYAAFAAALAKSIDLINHDLHWAAETYVKVTNSKNYTPDQIYQMISEPANQFTLVPSGMMNYAGFLYKIGRIDVKPEIWKDLFFPNAYEFPGS